MPNKFKHLILILVILGVLLPWPVSAIFIGESVAIFNLILQGISEKTMWMTFLMIGTLMFYIVGVVILWLSLAFLPLFIQHQTLWMEALKPMTMSGWSFTVGLANMLLIIIFVVIAFAFIFRIESLQAKKALPRLLIIAFLINFSMLFVNMAIDISQILFETIIAAVERTHGSFSAFFGIIRSAIIAPLFASAVMLGVLITTLIVLFSIPYVNAIAQIVFAALFFPVIFPIIVFLWAQMAFFIPLAAMFLTLTILFAARVFILQILTILAPLAFVSLILPQTKKFWNFWIQTLTEWLILGAVFLFLLVLGLSVLELLVPTISETIDPGLPQGLSWLDWILKWAVILIVFYLALLVYLGATLYIGKKFIPKGAEGILATVQGLGKTAMGATAGFAAGKLQQKFASRRATQDERTENRKKEAAGKMAARLRTEGPSRISLRQMAETGKWTSPFKKVTAEEMESKEKEAEHLGKAARKQEVRRRMSKMRDLMPEEHAAAIRKEMGRGKLRDNYKIEAHAKSCNLSEIDPELAGKIKKFIEPDENRIRLAKEISPTLFNEYKNEVKQKDAYISDAAAERKAAEKVIKGSSQERVDYDQRRLDNRMISEGISNIGARKFADVATPKMFNNIHVFFGMNQKQLGSLMGRGSQKSGQSLHNLIQNNQRELLGEYRKLEREGKDDRKKELKEMVKRINNNPNFK